MVSVSFSREHVCSSGSNLWDVRIALHVGSSHSADLQETALPYLFPVRSKVGSQWVSYSLGRGLVKLVFPPLRSDLGSTASCVAKFYQVCLIRSDLVSSARFVALVCRIWPLQVGVGGRSDGLVAMFCRSVRMPNPSIYKVPLIRAQIQSGFCLSTVWCTLAMAGIVVSKRSSLLLDSAMLRKGELLRPRTKGSLK